MVTVLFVIAEKMYFPFSFLGGGTPDLICLFVVCLFQDMYIYSEIACFSIWPLNNMRMISGP